MHALAACTGKELSTSGGEGLIVLVRTISFAEKIDRVEISVLSFYRSKRWHCERLPRFEHWFVSTRV